jgi:hypothetical protein
VTLASGPSSTTRLRPSPRKSSRDLACSGKKLEELPPTPKKDDQSPAAADPNAARIQTTALFRLSNNYVPRIGQTRRARRTDDKSPVATRSSR